MGQHRICADCGETLSGRTDKRFCSDACRNHFHNRRNTEKIDFVKSVNQILWRNRRILEELNPSGCIKIHKNRLLQSGFDFGYFTEIYKTPKGGQYFFCYDYGYLPLKEGFYFLVKRKEKLLVKTI